MPKLGDNIALIIALRARTPAILTDVKVAITRLQLRQRTNPNADYPALVEIGVAYLAGKRECSNYYTTTLLIKLLNVK